MGNHLGCLSSAVHASSQVTVLHSDDAQISEFHEPLQAAELMLEYPNQFVCHSSVLHNGQRITALAADDDLRMGQLYLLLPMRKLNGRFSPEDLAFFTSLASKVSMKPCKSGHSKVIPLPQPSRGREVQGKDSHQQPKCGQVGEPRPPIISLSLRADAADDNLELPPMATCTRQAMISRSKSWMPKLETINEMSIAMAC